MSFDVFVIGPMRPIADSVEIPTHTKDVKHAVRDILRRHGLTHVTVTAPDDLDGRTIATDVFTRLDAAELVVADISTCSPNVLYELAFVDALGLPTILVCDEATDVPFYFEPLRVKKVPAFSAETVATALEKVVLAAVRAEGTDDLFSNPLRDFYQAPVVDISAAAGLAAGYYVNFVRDVIRNDGIIERSGGRARGLMVVVPDKLSNQRATRKVLEQRVAKLTGHRIQRDRRFSRAKGERSFTAALVGRMILDVCSAPYSLDYSPRMRQLRRRLQNRPDLGRVIHRERVGRMTRSLLAAFVRSLRDQIDADHDTHRDRILVATPATLSAAVRKARKQGFVGA